jgi:hypothetical protein
MTFTQVTSIVAGDFDGDGLLDVAVTVVTFQVLGVIETTDAEIRVIYGKGDGTFRGEQTIAHPGVDMPLLLVPANIDGDKRTDLAYSFNEYLQTTNMFGMPISQFVRSGVTALLNRGGGAFSAVTTYDTVQLNDVLLAGPFDAGTTTDLVAEVQGSTSDSIELFHGLGNGGFTISSQDLGVKVAQIEGSTSFTTADFTGNGLLDLAFASEDDSSGTPQFGVATMLNDGTGQFITVGPPGGFLRIASPLGLVSADFNGDGQQDLAVIERQLAANQLGSSSLGVAFVLLNLDGTGFFFTPSFGLPSAQVQSTPQLADIDGDNVNDIVIVDRSGNVLYRKGLTPLGAFVAPVIVNPGMPARDAVVYATKAGFRIAALDARPDPGTGLYNVRLYALQSDGSFTQTGSIAVGAIASRIAAGRLDNDTLDDLIVTNGASGDVSILLQTSPDSFTEFSRPSVGEGPLDVALANIDGVGGLDAIITNQVSGDVSVLLNPGTSDTRELRFRSGEGLHGVLVGGLAVTSQQRPASVAVLPSSGSNRSDVLVADTGAATIAKLSAAGFDGFADALTAIPGIEADAIVTGFLNNDNLPDAVVLDASKSTVTVYLGTQSGGFTALSSMDIGLLPSGLTLANVDGKGGLDLLVGNQFGDVRLFLGNGDGTFSPFRPPAGAVPLDVTDINGDGVPDAILADQNANLVSVRTRIKGTDSFTQTFQATQATPQLLEPGKVLWRDLNNDGLQDAVVAASGSNSILVYLNSRTGLRTAAVYPTGTNPTSMAFMDFNNDGVPDLAVTNSGSNDVSILFGSIQNGQWVAVPGPRLRAGTGPGDIELRDINIRAATGNPSDPGFDGIPDLIVADNGMGTVRVLPGVGNGFFNDTNPVTLNLGAPIVDMSGNFALLNDGRVVGFNLAAGTVTPIFTDPRGATSLETVNLPGLAFPALFTGNADGTVSALLSADGTSYFEAAARSSVALEDPGAISVQTSASGGVEVYVTDRNSDGLVVLHFGADELTLGLSAIEGAPLAVVATLTNSLVVENISPAIDYFTAGENLFSSSDSTGTPIVEGEQVVALGQKLLSGINDALTTLAALPPGAEVPLNLQQFIVGVDEALQKLGLKNEVDAMGSLQDPKTDIIDWLRRAKEAIERMLQNYQPPKKDISNDAGNPMTPPEQAPPESNPDPVPHDLFFGEMNFAEPSATGEMEALAVVASQPAELPAFDQLTPMLIAAMFIHRGSFPRIGSNDRTASRSPFHLRRGRSEPAA